MQKLITSTCKIMMKIKNHSIYFCILTNDLLIKIPQACNFTKNEALAQMFSSEFCKIFKSTLFSPNTGKYGPKKTPYLDNFHALFIVFIDDWLFCQTILAIITTEDINKSNFDRY